MNSSLFDRLQRRDYRFTPQRRAVARVLEGRDVHLTADEVHALAVEIVPEVSRATVYSTLREWAGLGEIRELNLEGRSRHYDPNVAAHHHLVCEGCGSVFDVQVGIDPPALTEHELHGMQVDRSEIVHYGICQTCAVR